MTTKTRAIIEDLYCVPENGKAELIDGEIKLMSPTGARPGRASGKIYSRLSQHEEQHGGGYAFPDNVGFVVDNLPRRQSFSPDAAWHTHLPEAIDNLSFVTGAPTFAVEVRSENDYGPTAERDMTAKRDDYFAAGTLVVWDVNLLSPDVVKKYTPSNPDVPIIFRRGDAADAEPAVPGWTMPVDALFA